MEGLVYEYDLFGDRGDRSRGSHYHCPVPDCGRTGFGEQRPTCPDHPYREMEED